MPSVLLVEDDQSIQSMYAFGLRAEGFTVTTAPSGAEALVRVEEQTFDFILLDMLMTGMSGLDFLRSYDIRTKAPQTIVIALSNIDNPAIAAKAKELGAREYLTKANYEAKELTGHLKTYLDPTHT